MRQLIVMASVMVLLVQFSAVVRVHGDSSKYPQYAQQNLPPGVTPEFIKVSALVDEIVNRKRPLMIDVRSTQEYEEGHIRGSISVPLDQFADRISEIPRDRPVVLY